MNTKTPKQEDEFEVVFEADDKPKGKKVAVEDDNVDIEIEDDTPPEDRGRERMPAEIVAELEADDLDKYAGDIKQKIKQYKKVWHDERREKERFQREQTQAIELARRALEENKRLKSTLASGEKTYIETAKAGAQAELESARKNYKEAYESGDADKLLAAQEALTSASIKFKQAENYKPSLQDDNTEVSTKSNEVQTPQPNPVADAWYKKNPWWGTDEDMTGLAAGYHNKLARINGKTFVGTDAYWAAIDKEMRRRFPEKFDDSVDESKPDKGDKTARRQSAPATVVAPASRSTSPKKVVLKASELAVAKKFGLTPEQYAREKLNLEKR